MEHAVDAEADDERILLRLEVDVGGAVLGSLEDDGVDEPDERRVGDPVLGLEVVGRRPPRDAEVGVDLLQHRAGAECLRGARHPAQLGEDVLARGNAEIERVAGREPELVEAVQVAWIGDGDPQRAVVERVRDRDDALEDVQRDQLGGFLRDAGQSKVDDGDLVANGERASDPLGRRDPLVDDRLRKRALARPATHDRELVRRDEVGGGEQVDHQLRHRVDAERRGKRLRAGGGSFIAGLADRAQIRWTFAVHIPRSSYRQARSFT